MHTFNRDTLQWHLDEEKIFKYNVFKKATLVSILTFLVFVVYSDLQGQKNRDTIVSQNTKIKALEANLDSVIKSKDLPLTLKTVDWVVDLLPFKDKALIKKQYRVESGNLKSKLVFTNANLMGMKNSGKRPQPGCRSKINDYRHYDHWIFSIFDRYLYELKHGTSLKGYAEDPHYLKKVK